MATYKLGPVYGTARFPGLTCRRPLVCEWCAEALGNVDSAPQYQGVSAYLVAVMWPEMKAAVDRHEKRCLTPNYASR